MAPRAVLVVSGALIAAINAAVLLHALADIHDADAIATGAFHHFYRFNCRGHGLHS